MVGSQEMREGDWICKACGDLQFARNKACRKCGAISPNLDKLSEAASIDCGVAASGHEVREGDWTCSFCDDHVFARNNSCRRCGNPKSAIHQGNNQEILEGDWMCPGCGDHVFSRRSSCRTCGTHKPVFSGRGGGGCRASSQEVREGDVREGDWICPGCGDHVFARSKSCRQCGMSKMNAGGSHNALGCGARQAAGGMGGGRSGCGGEPRVQKFQEGDWECPNCGDHVFARNSSCRQCGTSKTTAGGSRGCGGCGAKRNEQEVKEGDWTCPQCGDHVFARSSTCRQCGSSKMPSAGKSTRGMMGGSGMGYMGAMMARKGGMQDGKAGMNGQTPREGDWSCPGCGDLQFGRNTSCRKCGMSKPEDSSGMGTAMMRGAGRGVGSVARGGPVRATNELRVGDWHCPNCSDMQFARNNKCRRCGTDKPSGTGTRSQSRSRSPHA